MADLFPTRTRLALLADVDALKVADDPDELAPYLDLGDGERAGVANGIREMERAGWVWQPADILGWRITDAGRAVLEAGER